jgi:hypothetical protein
MSGTKFDRLCNLLAAIYPDMPPLFANHNDLYSTIDTILQGNIPWEYFSVSYNGELPEDREVPSWMRAPFEVWYQDPLSMMEGQIGNPNFAKEFDFALKQVLRKDGKCEYSDLMSGNQA